MLSIYKINTHIFYNTYGRKYNVYNNLIQQDKEHFFL